MFCRSATFQSLKVHIHKQHVFEPVFSMRQLDADFPGPHIQVLPPPPLSPLLKPPMPSQLPSLQWSDSGYFSVSTSPSCQDMRLGLGGNWEVFYLIIIINHNTSIWNIHPSTDPYYGQMYLQENVEYICWYWIYHANTRIMKNSPLDGVVQSYKSYTVRGKTLYVRNLQNKYQAKKP